MDPRYRHFERCMERDYDHCWQQIHEDCRHALFGYLVWGWQPGGFLTAVLTNDLRAAAGRADSANISRLGFVALFVSMVFPGSSHGSAGAMDAWMARTDRDREELLIARGLLPTLFEVIRDPSCEST